MHIIFECADAGEQKLSKLVHAGQNYSLSKLACCFETTVYIHMASFKFLNLNVMYMQRSYIPVFNVV